MPMKCMVCLKSLDQRIFESEGEFCVSSLAKPMRGKIEVYWCEECGHLQTLPVKDIHRYYQEDYNILVESEDEDQLYGIVNGKKVFRAELQLNTLLHKIDIPDRARVLDYGCGKAPVLKLLCAARPGIIPHLFDVSDAYIPFWARFAKAENWSLNKPSAKWSGDLDVVLSFFALEHTSEPREFVADVARILRPGGLFYFVIPNPFGANASDMLVSDHVNHFSRPSLTRLLHEAGFTVESIDEEAHDLAYVVVARRTLQSFSQSNQPSVTAVEEHVRQLVELWSNVPARIADFERQHPGPSAIYGAGFCGCYIALHLQDLRQLACYIDQNPYKQGKQLLDKPIVSLESFAKTSDVVYVGLNPARARATIDQISAWRDRHHHYFFL
jgi:SAM-dependent methyltransferase